MRRMVFTLAVLPLLAGGPARAHPAPREAERALGRVLEERESPDTLIARAARRRELGDRRGAGEDLARAAGLSGVDPAALALERARLAATGEDQAAAEQLFGEALAAARPAGAAEPSRLYADALQERAALRQRLGFLDQARADWDASFAARPDAAAALARGALDEATGDPTRAATGYRQALGVVDAIALRRALARAEMAGGAWDAAVAVADAALAGPSARVEWLLIRGDAHEGAGRAERARTDRLEALDEADRTLAARPSDLRRLARARALLALGRAGEATTEADAVARAHPHLDEARTLLAKARRRLPAPPGSRNLPSKEPR